MKSYVKVLVACCLVMGTVGCAPSGTNFLQKGMVLQENGRVLRVGGEDSAISGFILPVKESFEEENAGTTLDIVRSRPGTELVGLERGEVDAVVTMQSLDDLVRAAADENVIIDRERLQITQVGKNDIVIVLNKGNNLKKLTKKQLRGIFSGKTTNWKQLRGANRGIVVVWNSAAIAENSLFLKEILAEEALALEPLSVYSFEEVRTLVAKTPGAIGIAPAGYIAAGVNAPTAPRYTSPVILITKGDPSTQLKKLTDILKDVALLQ